MTSRNGQNGATGLTRRNMLQLAAVTAAAGLGGIGVVKSVQEPVQNVAAAAGAKQRYDLSALRWQLSGYMPYMERLGGGATAISNIHQTTDQKVGPIPASVPGSVQLALLNAGLIKD